MAAPESAAPAEPPAGAASCATPPPESLSPQSAKAQPGLIAQVQKLMRELPGLFSDRVDLFVLELERASQALAQVVVLVLFTAIVAATCWMAFWGAVVSVLVDMGWSTPLALLAVLGLNLLAAIWALLRLRKLLPLLSLPVTRRHMSFGKTRDKASDASTATPESASDHAKSP